MAKNQRKIIDITEVILSRKLSTSKNKIEAYRKIFNDFGAEELQKVNPIAVNSNNVLIDGFCTYQILQENSIREAIVVTDCPSGYVKLVYGKHFMKGDKLNLKEYAWVYLDKKNPLRPNGIMYAPNSRNFVQMTDVAYIDRKEYFESYRGKYKKIFMK